MEVKKKIIRERICQSIETKKAILNNRELINNIWNVAFVLVQVLESNGKVLICGNGGSASDSLHMAGELVGRFQKERKGCAVMALNADIASMTAIANDYGYSAIFERAVEAYMSSHDLLIGISTSGNSENVYRALLKAKDIGGKTVAFLGKDGGRIAKIADYSLIVPNQVTARVQESHILLIHIICELIEDIMF